MLYVNIKTRHTMFYLSQFGIIGDNCLGPYTLYFPCIYKKDTYYEVVELQSIFVVQRKGKAAEP